MPSTLADFTVSKMSALASSAGMSTITPDDSSKTWLIMLFLLFKSKYDVSHLDYF